MAMISTMFESYCELQRSAIGQGAKGGTTQVWPPNGGTVLMTQVPCSYQEGPGGMDTLYGQRNDSSGGTIYTDRDILAHVNDRAVVTCPRTGEVICINVTGNTQPVARGRFYVTAGQRINAPRTT